MRTNLIAKKCGMSFYIQKDGRKVPATLIHIEPNKIVTVKTMDSDGYQAVQVAVGAQKVRRLKKPLADYALKSNLTNTAKIKNVVDPFKILRELRLEDSFEISQLSDKLELNLIDLGVEAGSFIDVTGITKGKGFAGTVKRHNFQTQHATHGVSLSHRAPGSIGQCQTPGRVFKGKKMSGQMGNVKRTTLALEVLFTETLDDGAGELLMVKGCVPGKPGGYLSIRMTSRKKKQK